MVECPQCSSQYPVRDGVLDLHADPSDTAAKEAEAHRAMIDRYVTDYVPEHLRVYVNGEKAVETLLELPYCRVPKLVESVEAFQRLNALAPDYFALLDRMGLGPEDVVIEVGSAGCWSARRLRERAGVVIATDISPNLYQAQAILPHVAHFDRVLCDMTVMPFRDAMADFVFGVATIHHLDALEPAFAQFHRVLKPGGRAVFFEEPVAGRWDRRAKESFGVEDKELGFQEHVYTIPEYFSAARRAGLIPSVEPLPGLLADPARNWPRARKIGLRVLRSRFGYSRLMTRFVYPFMLWFYPRIPFPRFGLVLRKRG